MSYYSPEHTYNELVRINNYTMVYSDRPLIFYVNGKKIEESAPDPEINLLFYLRKIYMPGTKLGCGEGGCGACTVMISTYSPQTNTVRHLSVNACLMPLCSVHGMAVTTVEGIGSIRNGLHPVQERIANSHGTQCGFCTPGIVMSMYTLLRNNPQPTTVEMDSYFEGNLCRCTGYRPILEGFKPFTKEYCQNGRNCDRKTDQFNEVQINETLCSTGDKCCRNYDQLNGYVSDETFLIDITYHTTQRQQSSEDIIENGIQINKFCFMGDKCCKNNDQLNRCDEMDHIKENGFWILDSTQDPIFPPELRTGKFKKENLHFKGENIEWFKPASLYQLLQLKAKYLNAKIVAGNTEVGVEVKQKNKYYPVLIDVTQIPELNTITETDNGIKFGSSVSLTDVNDTLQKRICLLPDHQTYIFSAIVEMLKWFAGRQIRNVATVGGNIVTASPISDLNPLFLAAGAVLEVASTDGSRRTIQMDESFCVGYRETKIGPDDILLNITLPFSRKNEYFGGYKQAHRKEDDIAIVNAGFRVLFQENSNVIKEIAISFGGMAAITLMTVDTMKKLIGRRWEDGLVEGVSQLMANEMQLSQGAPGGMVEYRRTLTTSFFFKFYLTVQLQLQQKIPSLWKKVPESSASAAIPLQKGYTKGTQIYEEVPLTQPQQDPVGRALPHLSAMKQATGEAVYVDDMPSFQGELYLALVTSQKPHAKILKVDPTEALKLEGVVDFISHKDVQGSKTWGLGAGEEAFASTEVLCIGQVIAAIVADTQAHAKAAARKVHIQYQDLPHIITTKEAVKRNSYFDPTKTISCGDVTKGFQQSDHIIEGEVHIGGQEHFYLETNVTLAVPKNEDGEMELFISSQNPCEAQMAISKVLGVDANKVLVRVKRLGGAFGGKVTRTQCISIPVAVAAYKLRTPVRCMLDRDEDMLITGTRGPLNGHYKVGFTNEGKILSTEVDMVSNAGFSLDRSGSTMEYVLLQFGNAYKIPNVKLTGRVCKTNIASNTAFRAFGSAQSMIVTESFIDDIATFLDADPNKMRHLNMYKEGEGKHFGQPIEQCNLDRCWEECLSKSDFIRRRGEVEKYNSENRWKKRGICIIPMVYGCSFSVAFLNQAGALVMIYKDGSVLLTHGGVEMGQGLHTKMIQVASRVLGVPPSKIHTSEISTNTVPNASSTAASSSSDLYGMAVQTACQTLVERLEPYIKANPKESWEDWVNSAYYDRVSLSATGFYKTPDITGYNFETQSGRPFNYFSFGAGCSEVEIDCLTGDHKVIRTDIVMDVGCSLNPTIDIGQIEGAFIQGYGYMMLEQHKISPDGFLYTRGPGTYKIPGFGNIPEEFNVSLLKGSENKRAVYSSKGIGEPPMLLSASVFFAVKDAIRSARIDAKQEPNFTLNSPATPERIRMACKDQFTEQFPEPPAGSYTPWFVDL